MDGRIAACQRVVDLIHGALAGVIPERVVAACNGSVALVSFTGKRSDGSLWVYLETIGGGFGARHNKDGMDGVHVHMTNTSNLPLESLETEYPLTLLAYELVDGSGGAGRYRGGMGLRRVYRAEADCRVSVGGSRFISRPWGLFGGESGGLGAFRIVDAPERLINGTGDMVKGDVLEIITPGAGGFGPPDERAVAAVAADRRDGRL